MYGPAEVSICMMDMKSHYRLGKMRSRKERRAAEMKSVHRKRRLTAVSEQKRESDRHGICDVRWIAEGRFNRKRRTFNERDNGK
jgi:hypothetical protein